MIKKALWYINILCFLGFSQLYGTSEDDDSKQVIKPIIKPPVEEVSLPSIGDVSMYFSRGAIIAGSTAFFSRRCEEWAMELMVKLIQDNVQSKNPIFNFFIAGTIRGKTIVDAHPIAQERGKAIGILIGTMAVPIVLDCAISTYHSWSKIIQYVLAEDNEPVIKPKKWDYFTAGLGTTIIGTLAVLTFKVLKK